MYKLILIVLLLIPLQIVSSQTVKFGEVTIQELEEKYYPKDSSATAAYLYKYRNTYIQDENLVTEVYHKIKIYNKKALDFATKKIKLYKSNSADERVSGLKATTYNLVNGAIEIEKISKASIFKTEYHKRQDHYTFTMPNVKEGSIIEYKYKIYSPFFTNIDEYKFQHSIPVKKLYSKLYTPAFFKFNKKVKGFLPVIPKHSHKRDARIGVEVNITEYEMSDIPALEDELYVDNIENYRSGVEYELVAVNYATHIKYYSQTWGDVAKSINESDTFKNKIKKQSYYKDDLNNVLSSVTTNDDKIKKVFEFIKSKVKWNEIEGIYTFNGMPKAYKTGVGNVGDINLMMISMMRYAGLKAYPILLSTKDNGIPRYPTLSGLNYVICGIELDDKIILLDATSKYSNQNILPIRTMNWFGKLIRPNNTVENIPLTPLKPSTIITNMNVKISEDGGLEGLIRNVFRNHNAFQFREKYTKISNDDYLLEVESLNENIEISEYKLVNIENIDKPVVETFSFSKDDYIEIIGNKMYFSPLLFFALDTNPFLAEERLFPIDFIFPWNKKFQISLKVPEGYALESMPKSIKIKLPNNQGEFTYLIKKSNDNIQLSCYIKMESSKIPANQYTFLKQFYNQIIKKQGEKIILVKQ